MITLGKILVPTDFSEQSAKAIRYGAALAAQFDAELHLLHAVETTPVMYGEGAAYFPPETAVELKAVAVKQLDAVVIDDPGDIKISRTVAEGHTFVEIIRFAKENAIDLIVIGTHGRGAIAHMLLGSVAEKVLRKAPCPVLVVRDKQHDFIMP